MSTTVFTNRIELVPAAEKALNFAARFWFAVSVLGQWAFLYYIVAFYGTSTAQGNFQAWTKNKFLYKGYVPGDRAGNLAFAAHALLAAVIAFGGAVQIIPHIRKRWPRLHRWNGRTFLTTALALSASGLYMVWIRRSTPGLYGAIGVSLNGVLIILFAILAWRTAVQRNMIAHRRWALRTFIVSNGQWFTRIGMMAWMVLNHGKDRGFFRVWTFGSYLFPLLILELYLWAKDSTSSGRQYAVAGVLFVLTLLSGLGISVLTVFYGKLL
ncbi:MAG TPA: DUF2306 domain-containing protein [Thermoanaerobaculia bacterium]|nr:DUF2306 domain-containing protein [Thermoanaerobaculia bacterium]